MSFSRHAIRVGLLMIFAAGLLGWTASRTPVIWADGLRYIGQAKVLEERGLSRETISRAVDHPLYPLAISTLHRFSADQSPSGWQFAAQAASVISAVLLVIPLYLVALELFGSSAAWIACVVTFLVPVTGHVLADALSESTFLLFWMWGLWFALRFLREGNPTWLPAVLIASALAYLTRPEGLLIPAATIASLVLMPCFKSTRLSRKRWWIAVSLLVIGPLVLVTPFIVIRGGIGTKPAVARLFGLSPKAPAMAIERERPVDEEQTAATTLMLGARAMLRAIQQATTLPLLIVAPLGIMSVRARGKHRALLMMTAVVGGWILALIRLHATGGYCTPRHSLIASLPLIASGTAGMLVLFRMIFDRLEQSGRLLAESRKRLEPIGLAVLFAGVAAWWSPETLAPLNRGYSGYRMAGAWLESHSQSDAKVMDLKGWALFYSARPGYSFATIGEGSEDREVRWLVAHDSLLTGPWFYCDIVRNMVQGRKPVESFPKVPEPGVARVHVFDLSSEAGRRAPEVASSPGSVTKSR